MVRRYKIINIKGNVAVISSDPSGNNFTRIAFNP